MRRRRGGGMGRMGFAALRVQVESTAQFMLMAVQKSEMTPQQRLQHQQVQAQGQEVEGTAGGGEAGEAKMEGDTPLTLPPLPPSLTPLTDGGDEEVGVAGDVDGARQDGAGEEELAGEVEDGGFIVVERRDSHRARGAQGEGLVGSPTAAWSPKQWDSALQSARKTHEKVSRLTGQATPGVQAVASPTAKKVNHAMQQQQQQQQQQQERRGCAPVTSLSAPLAGTLRDMLKEGKSHVYNFLSSRGSMTRRDPERHVQWVATRDWRKPKSFVNMFSNGVDLPDFTLFAATSQPIGPQSLKESLLQYRVGPGLEETAPWQVVSILLVSAPFDQALVQEIKRAAALMQAIMRTSPLRKYMVAAITALDLTVLVRFAMGETLMVSKAFRGAQSERALRHFLHGTVPHAYGWVYFHVPANVQLRSVLGTGVSGTVYRATVDGQQEDHAVKIVGGARTVGHEAAVLCEMEHSEGAITEVCLQATGTNILSTRPVASGSRPRSCGLDYWLALWAQCHNAHTKGWVHGDIREANIAHTSNRTPLLIDWGSAAPHGQDLSSYTGTALTASERVLQYTADRDRIKQALRLRRQEHAMLQREAVLRHSPRTNAAGTSPSASPQRQQQQQQQLQKQEHPKQPGQQDNGGTAAEPDASVTDSAQLPPDETSLQPRSRALTTSAASTMTELKLDSLIVQESGPLEPRTAPDAIEQQPQAVHDAECNDDDDGDDDDDVGGTQSEGGISPGATANRDEETGPEATTETKAETETVASIGDLQAHASSSARATDPLGVAAAAVRDAAAELETYPRFHRAYVDDAVSLIKTLVLRTSPSDNHAVSTRFMRVNPSSSTLVRSAPQMDSLVYSTSSGCETTTTPASDRTPHHGLEQQPPSATRVPESIPAGGEAILEPGAPPGSFIRASSASRAMRAMSVQHRGSDDDLGRSAHRELCATLQQVQAQQNNAAAGAACNWILLHETWADYINQAHNRFAAALQQLEHLPKDTNARDLDTLMRRDILPLLFPGPTNTAGAVTARSSGSGSAKRASEGSALKRLLAR